MSLNGATADGGAEDIPLRSFPLANETSGSSTTLPRAPTPPPKHPARIRSLQALAAAAAAGELYIQANASGSRCMEATAINFRGSNDNHQASSGHHGEEKYPSPGGSNPGGKPTAVTSGVSVPSSTREGSAASAPTPGPSQRAVVAARPTTHTLAVHHLVTIAVGSSIGTGLFVGTGQSLARAGPAGLLLGFLAVAVLLYTVMDSLAEMATFAPPKRGGGAVAAGFAARFWHPGVAFAAGWLYWAGWAATWALELDAVALIIDHWQPPVHKVVWMVACHVVFTLSNLLPVRANARLEAALAIWKVLTVFAFALFCAVALGGHTPGGNELLGAGDYWTGAQGPGAFGAGYLRDDSWGKWCGFWAVLVQAAFAYQGTELVALGTSEMAASPAESREGGDENGNDAANNPTSNVSAVRASFPLAVRLTFWLMVLLFLTTVVFIGLMVPSDSPSLLLDTGQDETSASPFVIAAQRAGVPGFEQLLNAVLLTAILSAGNMNVYAGSRILAALAEMGMAWRCFAIPDDFGGEDAEADVAAGANTIWARLRRLWKHYTRGVPVAGVLATSAMGGLAYINLSSSSGEVFLWLAQVSAVTGLTNWVVLLISHWRMMRAMKGRGIDRRAELRTSRSFVSWGQPYVCFVGMAFGSLVLLTQGFDAFYPGWDWKRFLISYCGIALFAALLVGHVLSKRSRTVALGDIDLDGNKVG